MPTSDQMLELQQLTQSAIMSQINRDAARGMALERMVITVFAEFEKEVRIEVLDRDELPEDIKAHVRLMFGEQKPGTVSVLYSMGGETSVTTMFLTEARGDQKPGLLGGETVPIYLDGPEKVSNAVVALQMNTITELRQAVRQLLAGGHGPDEALLVVTDVSVLAGEERSFVDMVTKDSVSDPSAAIIAKELARLPRRGRHLRVLYITDYECAAFNIAVPADTMKNAAGGAA